MGSHDPSQSVGPSNASPLSVPEAELIRQCDVQAVQNALYRYKEEPLVLENELLDLVQWWDVSEPTYVHRVQSC